MYNPDNVSRRTFLASAAVAGFAAMSLPSLSAMGKTFAYNAPGTGLDLAVAKNGTPAENTVAAIKALGGIERFVKRGDKVALKPNIVSSSGPEYAINTHRDVVGTVTRLCMEAGASEVAAVSNDRANYFIGSGMGDAITRAGGAWEAVNVSNHFRDVILPRGILLRRTQIMNKILDADVFINLPIAKHHADTLLTGGMKNLMGINFDRQIMHARGIHQCIADLSTAVKPHLIILDANYILLSNGPGGPGTTRNQKTIIAGTDPVLVDAYAATMFQLDPGDIGYVRFASEMGMGSMDLKAAQIEEFSLQ